MKEWVFTGALRWRRDNDSELRVKLGSNGICFDAGDKQYDSTVHAVLQQKWRHVKADGMTETEWRDVPLFEHDIGERQQK